MGSSIHNVYLHGKTDTKDFFIGSFDGTRINFDLKLYTQKFLSIRREFA